MSKHDIPLTVDAYIASAPEAVQPILHRMRALIRAAAPDAAETLSYGMPAYKGRRALVWFAANKNHLGFYPTPSAMVRFQTELFKYKTSKGAIQFPYAEPLPEELIAKIVRFRAEEDRAV
ncbi:MAG: DUF1801 domain-containing protein [Bacillota bacterium]